MQQSNQIKTNQTRAEQQEEKKQRELKYFDYAESAVKEWIALYVKQPVQSIFDDYKHQKDVIVTESNNTYYTACVDATPFVDPNDDLTVTINPSFLEKNPNLAKALAMLFEAVYVTYGPIVHTMLQYREKMTDIFPKFDQHNMCFGFVMVNRKDIERNQCIEYLLKINQQLEQLSTVNATDNTPATDSLKNQLLTLRTDYITKVNTYSIEDIQAYEQVCNSVNNNLANAPKLYLVVEKNVKQSDETIAKRLPEIGARYTDPDEKTIIDQLKEDGIVD